MGTGLSRPEDRGLAEYPLICPGGTSARVAGMRAEDGKPDLRHFDETPCQHYPWLTVLASRKRRTVNDMRDIMEPHVNALLKTALLNYTGWLDGMLNSGKPEGAHLDAEALVDAFLRAVADAE